MAVTVLGTGSIGTAVARVLLGAGREVHVWNRTPGRAAGLVGEGALLAPSAADAVDRSHLTLVSVTDHAAVQSLLEGLPGRPRAGTTVVLLTTGSPEEVRRSARLAASRGLTCLGAGVQTAPTDVGTPRALFLYAGERPVFERHRDDLEVLGPARWVGPHPSTAAELDQALFGLWYDAQIGLLRAFEMTGNAGVPPTELVALAAAQLRHVVAGVETTARELAERDYPRGPASLAEHAPVLARLRESRRASRLGDGGLGEVARVVEELASGPGSGRGLTAVLDRTDDTGPPATPAG